MKRILFPFVILMLGIFTMAEAAERKGRLENKVALITGAGKGLGRSIAQVFAQEGAHVILVSRTESDLKKLTGTITQTGGKASYIVGDVTKPIDMDRMAATILKDHGRIDILIHNAGIYPVAPITDMTVTQWQHVIETNLNSTFYVVKACLPTMKKQKYGRIVLTSSISGPSVGWPGGAHYTASKAGMNGFMKTVAIELARDNITVNAVEPGNFLSEGLEDMGAEHIQKIASGIPMGRLGTPEEVAYAHLFLASDEARYITGQSIIVDGGQVLPESDDHMRMHVK